MQSLHPWLWFGDGRDQINHSVIEYDWVQETLISAGWLISLTIRYPSRSGELASKSLVLLAL